MSPFHSCTNFEAYVVNSLRLSDFINFSHFTAQVRLFFVQKRKPNILGFRNVKERRMGKIITFVIN